MRFRIRRTLAIYDRLRPSRSISSACASRRSPRHQLGGEATWAVAQPWKWRLIRLSVPAVANAAAVAS